MYVCVLPVSIKRKGAACMAPMKSESRSRSGYLFVVMLAQCSDEPNACTAVYE